MTELERELVDRAYTCVSLVRGALQAPAEVREDAIIQNQIEEAEKHLRIVKAVWQAKG